jgi:uncharacterized repeat protein (TIGR01451 family)
LRQGALSKDRRDDPGHPGGTFALLKRAQSSKLIAGQETVFTLGVTNYGPSGATHLVLTDTLRGRADLRRRR